jgi:N6-adenosine-specific RNA methylase IME4
MVDTRDGASTPPEDLLSSFRGRQFGTILADPPWQFTNRTGKMAPEHRRLLRYPTMTLDDILDLPVADLSLPQSHLYLWVPNALIFEGLEVMKRWGFTYKTNLVWYKVRKDGGPDGRGVGFYFRNVTELVLFGTRGSLRTFQPGRRQVNVIVSQKREHSRKPDELYDVIEDCSPGPYLELFARRTRSHWMQWGNEVPQELEADALYGVEQGRGDTERHIEELTGDVRHHTEDRASDIRHDTSRLVREGPPVSTALQSGIRPQ